MTLFGAYPFQERTQPSRAKYGLPFVIALNYFRIELAQLDKEINEMFRRTTGRCALRMKDVFVFLGIRPREAIASLALTAWRRYAQARGCNDEGFSRAR